MCNKLGGRSHGLRPCKLTIHSGLFARWQLFRHVGYLKHQQLTFDLLTLKLVSKSRTCDVGYLCANFSIPVFLVVSVLELGPIRDRQTYVRQKHRL